MKTIGIDPLLPLTAQLRAVGLAEHLGKTALLYRFHDAAGTLLYVGVTVNPVMRWQQHKRKPWWAQVASVSVEEHPYTNAALDAELVAIRTEAPLHNLRSIPRTIPEWLRNETGAITQGNGREGNGRGMEAVVKVVCGVYGSDRIRNNGDLGPRSFGFGHGEIR